ncbi:MAG: hydantoinase B/oxoprolinase family protein, partial [Chloroflexi bacterium]|nr:hydantoinase B/oxoprolinase family protein [Chloroflexota bacterium]
ATVMAAVGEVWDQSERLARAEVAAIPDGTYEAASCLDDDGYTPGRHLAIHVRVVVAGTEMTIDFSPIADQAMGPINSVGCAPAYMAFKALTTPRRPPDEGCFRPLRIVIPPGKLLSAVPPAAFGSWSWPFPTVMDVIFKAMAPAIPHKVAAGNCGMPYGAGFFHGTDPETGRTFVSLSLLPVGWGGRPTADGVTAGGMILGFIRDTPAEVTETLYPLLVERVGFVTNSGGVGRYRGGLGVEYRFRCLADTFTNVELGRTACPPWGLFGGGEGQPGANVIEQPDGSRRALGNGAMNLRLPAGARAVVRTGGGGGCGDPRARTAERVRDDVLDGYVSAAAARAQYGVAVDPETGAIDEAETARLRGNG